MRGFCLALLLVTALAVAAGFYFGWLSVTTEQHDGTFTLSLNVRTANVQQAVESTEEGAAKIGASVKEHAPR